MLEQEGQVRCSSAVKPELTAQAELAAFVRARIRSRRGSGKPPEALGAADCRLADELARRAADDQQVGVGGNHVGKAAWSLAAFRSCRSGAQSRKPSDLFIYTPSGDGNFTRGLYTMVFAQAGALAWLGAGTGMLWNGLAWEAGKREMGGIGLRLQILSGHISRQSSYEKGSSDILTGQ
jgi:hypothetical protein